ncbi:hypothetical protein ACPA9J_32650 [Pseudomonas aeruginosa]
MVSLRPQGIASHELKAEIGNYNHKQGQLRQHRPDRRRGRFLIASPAWCATATLRSTISTTSATTSPPSPTWNIDDDTRPTFLSHHPDHEIQPPPANFVRYAGPNTDAPFGKISHHKNLGDPD